MEARGSLQATEHKLVRVLALALEELCRADLAERAAASGSIWNGEGILVEFLGRRYRLASGALELVESIEGSRLPARGAGFRTSVSSPAFGRPWPEAGFRTSVSSPAFGRPWPESDTQERGLSAKIIVAHYLTRAPGGTGGELAREARTPGVAVASPRGTPTAREPIGFDQIPGAAFYGGAFRGRVEVPIARMFGGNPKLLARAGAALGGVEVGYGDCAVRLPALPKVPVTVIVWQGDEEQPSNAKMLFDPSVEEYLSTEDITVLGELVVFRLKAQEVPHV